jgi:hypothetical protein
MAGTHIEISKVEVDPNRLGNFLSVPLPDFAANALVKNGIRYSIDKSGDSHSGNGERDLQQQHHARCKLKQHLHYINTHINKDGPRHLHQWDNPSEPNK